MALFPGLISYVCDTFGWRSLNRQIATRASVIASFTIHTASEAIVKTIPFGVPFSDSARAIMLSKSGVLSFIDGITTGVARRFHLGLSQGVFLMAGGLTLLFFGSRPGGAEWLSTWISLATGAGLVMVLLTGRAVLASSVARNTIAGLFRRLPASRIRERLLSRMRHDGASFINISMAAAGCYLLLWCAELFESYLFVLLLGIPASFPQVVAAEVMVSSLRLAGFFLPSGIGVQDIGYASAITAMVPSAPHVAAFVILKRMKDLFWIVIGYAILLAKGVRPFMKPAAAELPLETT